MWIAAAHNDKVVPALANQYDYCDGPAKTLAWYQSGYDSTVEPGDIVTYRHYVTDIVHPVRNQSDDRHVATRERRRSCELKRKLQ